MNGWHQLYVKSCQNGANYCILTDCIWSSCSFSFLKMLHCSVGWCLESVGEFLEGTRLLCCNNGVTQVRLELKNTSHVFLGGEGLAWNSIPYQHFRTTQSFHAVPCFDINAGQEQKPKIKIRKKKPAVMTFDILIDSICRLNGLSRWDDFVWHDQKMLVWSLYDIRLGI